MIEDARLIKLLKILWEQYKIDCPYAAKAQELFPEATNDHIAFRSVNRGKGGNVIHGIPPIKNFWEAFGYKQREEYYIMSKNIHAIHMEKSGFPKIFISEFMTQRLGEAQAPIVNMAFCNVHRNPFCLMEQTTSTKFQINLKDLSAEELANFFFLNPVPYLPTREQLGKLESISQYVAWVRLFGNMVNHFTLLVNSCDIKGFGESHIKAVYEEMKSVGIPMKDEIEGEGTELAQTSTLACHKKVAVKIGNEESVGYIDWPYAYYEIAERGTVMYQGFKAEQTKSLFEMTGKDKNG